MPVRILHIVTYMGRGGLETFLMNCYRNIDREKIQFDFLVHRSFRADYDDEIQALGGKIYRVRRLNPFHPSYYRDLFSFFHDHPEYRIVHCHLDCMSALPLFAAQKYGIPVRIAHAHSACQDKDWKYPLKRFFMRLIPRYATQLFACSRAAGDWMFPDCRFSVLRNGIDANVFDYDPGVRRLLRTSLSVEDKLVIGHAGRFAPAKNHLFLVEVFAQIHAQNPNAFLLLVGDGPLRKKVWQRIKELDLQDSAFLAGLQENTAPWYQAMDLFLFPSVYEGFGMAVLEAQAAGLSCVLSDTIPTDCILTDFVTQLPLTASAKKWADHILSLPLAERCGHQADVLDRGFDIHQTATFLQNFYLKAGG